MVYRPRQVFPLKTKVGPPRCVTLNDGPWTHRHDKLHAPIKRAVDRATSRAEWLQAHVVSVKMAVHSGGTALKPTRLKNSALASSSRICGAARASRNSGCPFMVRPFYLVNREHSRRKQGSTFSIRGTSFRNTSIRGPISTTLKMKQTPLAKHRILTEHIERLVGQHSYRVSQKYQGATRQQVQHLLKDDVIQALTSL
ncbi:hypothetical protein HPB51_021609 [Rhipicephalus microplus]|uniref:Uncharacterized protein n=1 Tax=Rhipicephalus microplus TaxID=6941 RepID=A0A9J6EC12_RHIMP|nr:hypothetical protein HPB51_021609 [Rhipicephalus microplus]